MDTLTEIKYVITFNPLHKEASSRSVSQKQVDSRTSTSEHGRAVSHLQRTHTPSPRSPREQQGQCCAPGIEHYSSCKTQLLLYAVMYNIIWGFFLLVSRRAQCLLSVYFLHNVSNFRLFIFFLPPNSSSHDTIWCLKDTGWHLVTPTQSSCNSVSSAEFRTTRHPLLYS